MRSSESEGFDNSKLHGYKKKMFEEQNIFKEQKFKEQKYSKVTAPKDIWAQAESFPFYNTPSHDTRGRKQSNATFVRTWTNARMFVAIAGIDGPLYEAVSKVAYTAL